MVTRNARLLLADEPGCLRRLDCRTMRQLPLWVLHDTLIKSFKSYYTSRTAARGSPSVPITGVELIALLPSPRGAESARKGIGHNEDAESNHATSEFHHSRGTDLSELILYHQIGLMNRAICA